MNRMLFAAGLLACLVAFASLGAAQTTDVGTVEGPGQNIKPQVAYSPVSDTFLVTWLKYQDVASDSTPQLWAAAMQADGAVSRQFLQRIFRTNPGKRQGSCYALAYDPAADSFHVLWLEINEEEQTPVADYKGLLVFREITTTGNNLVLTELSNSGRIVNRGRLVATGVDALLAQPFVVPGAGADQALIVWTELNGSSARTAATAFDTRSTYSARNTIHYFSAAAPLIEIPGSLAAAGANWRLVSNFVDKAFAASLRISIRELASSGSQSAGERQLTTEQVRQSLTLSAAPAADPAQTLVLYNANTPGYSHSSLALLRVGSAGQLAMDPAILTAQNSASREGCLLPAAFDGLARLLWVEKTEDVYYLKLQAVTDDGVLIGSPQIVQTSVWAIGSPAMAYDAGRDRAMAVWCEDFPDGTSKIMCRAVLLQ